MKPAFPLLPRWSDLTGLVQAFTKYPEPLAQFTQRLLHASMRRSSLGWGWLVLQPLIMMVAYVTVFTFVFPGTYGQNPTDTALDYAIGVYLSLTVFNFATDIIGGAPFLLEMHRSLLLNTRIPAEVFIVASVLASLIRFLAGLALCLLLAALLSHVHWTGLWLIPLVIVYTAFMLGLALVLSVLGVVVPDLRQLTALLSTVLMFSSAVFYPARLLPLWMQRINPLFQAVEGARGFVLWGRPIADGTAAFAVMGVFAVGLIAAGLVLLRRFRSLLTE
jgi:lipopolysaccharide transport system permease protein